MDSINCKCGKCDVSMGTLVNLWTQIGKNYITPVAYAVDDAAFKVSTTGSVRLGDPDTLVGGCHLQDVECAACHTNLGQKCVKSPVNHVLHDGQLIFRISCIGLRSASDRRRKVEPKINRVLKLKVEPARQTSADFDSRVHQEADFDVIYDLQTQLEAQREEIHRIGSTGFQRLTSLDMVITRFEQQARELESSIADLRKGRDGQQHDLKILKSEFELHKEARPSSDTLSRMGQQLRATDKLVNDVRQSASKTKSDTSRLREQLLATQQEVSGLREENARLKEEIKETKDVASEGVSTAKEYASEIVSLRREIQQIQTELAKEQSRRQTTGSVTYASHELEILASSISRIGHRASQVESLQMEFELFKTRIQRLENTFDAPTPRDDARSTISNFGPYGSNTRQKRPSAGRDDGQEMTPPKRLAVTSDYSSAMTAEYASVDDLRQSSPNDMAETRTQHRNGPRGRARNSSRRGARGRKV